MNISGPPDIISCVCESSSERDGGCGWLERDGEDGGSMDGGGWGVVTNKAMDNSKGSWGLEENWGDKMGQKGERGGETVSERKRERNNGE